MGKKEKEKHSSRRDDRQMSDAEIAARIRRLRLGDTTTPRRYRKWRKQRGKDD